MSKKEQFIYIDEDGNKRYFADREMTILHREDGPAIEFASGDKEWHLNGKCHREDGPAVEWYDGNKAWYLNDKRHREDGPAIEYADGLKEWYLNGKLHREDGPAVEYPDGLKEWYLNGEFLTEKLDIPPRMDPVELTLDEIAEKFGVSVDKLKIKK